MRLKCRKSRLRGLALSALAIVFFTVFIFQRTVDFVISLLDTDIREFAYPIDLPNFPEMVDRFRSGNTSVTPINVGYSQITFLQTAVLPADHNRPLGFLIVIKSATRNYKRRASIRSTWGAASYLRNTSLSPDLPTKLVFICGLPVDSYGTLGHLVQELFPSDAHEDIILGDFNDNYFNNTFKSVLALRWAVEEFPSDFKYLLLLDDDIYLNLDRLGETIRGLGEDGDVKVYKDFTSDSIPFFRTRPTGPRFTQGPRVPLYMGLLYPEVPTQRLLILDYLGLTNSDLAKWTISVEDYPYNKYPPFIAGAGIILSKSIVSDFYYASFFTKHIWIDDVFLGIIAYKLGHYAVGNRDFISRGHSYFSFTHTGEEIEAAILIHGFLCPQQMVALWRNRTLVDDLPDCDIS